MEGFTAEKLKAVCLHLEEGFSQALVCQELRIGWSTLVLWLQVYRLGGTAGLLPAPSASRKARLSAPITDHIPELKRQHPAFGIKRISQVLRRWFFLPASPGTVRQRLSAPSRYFFDQEILRTIDIRPCVHRF